MDGELHGIWLLVGDELRGIWWMVNSGVSGGLLNAGYFEDYELCGI